MQISCGCNSTLLACNSNHDNLTKSYEFQLTSIFLRVSVCPIVHCPSRLTEKRNAKNYSLDTNFELTFKPRFLANNETGEFDTLC